MFNHDLMEHDIKFIFFYRKITYHLMVDIKL